MAFEWVYKDWAHRPGRHPGGRHWYHEMGMPGWTRMRGGYPALHWSECGCTPGFNRRQELAMLRQEARELEVMLKDIRDRIVDLEED